MTLLVAASPCALALGTPAAILSGIAQAARNGVLIKGSVHLENLGSIKAIAFDKTGTVTQGKPEVTDIIPFKYQQNEILALAAAAESRSAHPLSQAIVRKAQTAGVLPKLLDQVEALTGHGLRAEFEGETLWLGNQTLLEAIGAEFSPAMIQQANDLQAAGKRLYGSP